MISAYHPPPPPSLKRRAAPSTIRTVRIDPDPPSYGTANFLDKWRRLMPHLADDVVTRQHGTLGTAQAPGRCSTAEFPPCSLCSSRAKSRIDEETGDQPETGQENGGGGHEPHIPHTRKGSRSVYPACYLSIVWFGYQVRMERHESGSRAIAITELPALARALNVPISYFFGDSDDPNIEGIDLHAELKSLSPDEKKMLLDRWRIDLAWWKKQHPQPEVLSGSD